MTVSATEASVQRLQSTNITVRRTKFQPIDLKRYYFKDQSPLMSHLLTALSLTFPEGEQFFVHSVRNVRNQVRDPVLQADISAFIGQKAMHAQAHAQFNAAMTAPDYRLADYDAFFAANMAELKRRSPRRQLAATVAYEHFTALIAGHILRHPAFFNGLDRNMQQLWLWHALEELEHKSVAFEVYQQVFGGDADSLAQRRRSMRTVSVGFVLGIAGMTRLLFQQDGKNNHNSLKKMLLNARDGYYIAALALRNLPDYLAFYRADFHPEQRDDRALMAKWRAKLA